MLEHLLDIISLLLIGLIEVHLIVVTLELVWDLITVLACLVISDLSALKWQLLGLISDHWEGS